LFHRIIAGYNRDAPLIREETLTRSWRSSPAVMDAVNGLFGHLGEVPGLPGAVVEKWGDVWQEHDAVRKNLSGCVEVYSMPREKGRGVNREARFVAVRALLEELDPVGRGLTAAVLVRSNQQGRELVDYLRASGQRVSWEGTFRIREDSCVSALVSLVRAASSPGDALAWSHLEMSPARDLWCGPGTSRGRLCLEVLEDVGAHGFEHLVRKWQERFRRAGLLDAGSRESLEDLAGAAAACDAQGVRDCLAFIRFVDDYELTDATSRAAVQVMTMHKAKGLEFDLVVLPDLEGHQGITRAAPPRLAVHTAGDMGRTPRWVLALPPRFIAEEDPALESFIGEHDAANCFEQLCLLYVAMTRARRGLYMVLTDPPRQSSALFHSTLVRTLLGTDSPREVSLGGTQAALLFRTGDPRWAISTAPLPEPGEGRPALPLPSPGSAETMVTAAAARRRRLAVRTPSGEESSPGGARTLFSRAARRAAETGTIIHRLFQQVEWSDGVNPDAVCARVRGEWSPSPECFDEACAHFRQAVQSPEIVAALRRPEGRATLWRERDFEIVVNESWVSGCFDRVVLEQDESGVLRAATIIDFKTGALVPETPADAVGTYGSQMRLYRQVLSGLTGLAEDRIGLVLLFTGACREMRLS